MTPDTPETLPDGREIITREPAYIEEMFGKKVTKPVQARGVDMLLLADGSTVYQCQDQDFTNASIQPVIRHRGKHAPSSRKYPPETIEQIMKWRELERAKGIRGWSERVAARLNKKGITRMDGKRWLANDVHNITSARRDQARAVTPEHDPIAALPPAPPARGLLGLDPDLNARAMDATHPDMAVKIITSMAEALAHQARQTCDHADYDELKAKAQMWDELRASLRKNLMGERE